MKPRERVEMALNHEEPDRCPMQISFTPEFADRLRADMEIQGRRVHNPHGGGNTYELERALGRRHAADFRWLGELLLYGRQSLCG